MIRRLHGSLSGMKKCIAPFPIPGKQRASLAPFCVQVWRYFARFCGGKRPCFRQNTLVFVADCELRFWLSRPNWRLLNLFV